MKTTLEARETIYVESVEQYFCPHCEDTSVTDDWESVNVYCPADYNWDGVYIEVGDNATILARFRNSVPENYLSKCPNCGDFTDSGNMDSVWQYECPRGCGETWDVPHHALLCCSDCDDPDTPCLCLSGLDSGNNPGVHFCDCHENCEMRVCTECHLYGFSWDLKDHACGVGVPASLPPAITWSLEVLEACDMCASEFCCSVHNNHKSPHRGHLGG